MKFFHIIIRTVFLSICIYLSTLSQYASAQTKPNTHHPSLEQYFYLYLKLANSQTKPNADHLPLPCSDCLSNKSDQTPTSSMDLKFFLSEINLNQNLSVQTDSEFNLQHQKNAQTLQNSDKEKSQAIVQLMRVFHHSIEGNHSHSIKDFFKTIHHKDKWASLLNFHQMIKRAVRAFNLESNQTELKNHVKNLALLFPISHFIEVMTAPSFVAMGTIHELPSLIVATGGAILSFISIPGLDPLCILLFSAYPLKPVHKSIDWIRTVIESAVRSTLKITKLNTLSKKLSQHQDRFLFIEQQINQDKKPHHLFTVKINSTGDQLSLINLRNHQVIASLKRTKNQTDGDFSIESIWISKDAPIDEVRKTLSPLLPWNTRLAINEVLNLHNQPQNSDQYEREFFTRSVSTTNNNGIRVSYRERAIHLRDKIKFSFQKYPCKKSFQ